MDSALDAGESIPFKVVVIGKLFTNCTPTFGEDAHPSLTTYYPLLRTAVRVA